MIIKNKDDNQDNVDYLSDLLDRDIDDDMRRLIDRELKNIDANHKDKEMPLYPLDQAFKTTKNWALIHDLRLDHGGDIIQIDHLVIGRMLDIYVIDSKNFSYGVAISEGGDFNYFYEDSPHAIASPIAINEQNISLLDRFLDANDLLPRRLGIKLQPKYRNVVLISSDAQLVKPKTGFYDCSAVMRFEKFVERFGSQLNKEGELDAAGLARVISQDSLQRFAEKLVLYHQACDTDYVAKFSFRNQADGIESEPPACPVCGTAMVKREAKKGKHVGKAFWGCPQFPKCRGAIEIDDDLDAGPVNTEEDAAGPACPKCKGPMVKRVSKKGDNAGREFWGCQAFPLCRGTVAMSGVEK